MTKRQRQALRKRESEEWAWQRIPLEESRQCGSPLLPVCHQCRAHAQFLYWPEVNRYGNELQPHERKVAAQCRRCAELGHLAEVIAPHSERSADVRDAAKMGDYAPAIMDMMHGTAMQGVRAMQALERAGVSERRLTLEHGRKRLARTRKQRKKS